MRRGGRELGRIEHDGIKTAALLDEQPQALVDVGVQRLVARRVEAVQRHVGIRLGQCRRRRIDAQHMRRAAVQCGHAEAAGVAKAVQHALAAELPHRIGERPAVVALVEVEAGLVAVRHIDAEPPAVLVDRHLGRPGLGRRRPQPAGRGRQAFEAAHAGIAAFVQARQAGGLEQQVGQQRLPALGAGRAELHAEHVAVAVDHQPGQAVGLGVDQAHAVAGDRQPRPHRQRALDAALQEAGVDALVCTETPGAHADHRARAVGAPGQKAAVGGHHAHGLARIGLAARNAALEHPGVAALQRTLLAVAQRDRFHGQDCRVPGVATRRGGAAFHSPSRLGRMHLDRTPALAPGAPAGRPARLHLPLRLAVHRRSIVTRPRGGTPSVSALPW